MADEQEFSQWDVVANVDRGIQDLNRVRPDWPSRINRRRFNIALASSCIVTQVFGDFDDGLRQLGFGEETEQGLDLFSFGLERGFSIPGDNRSGIIWMKVLQHEWERRLDELGVVGDSTV